MILDQAGITELTSIRKTAAPLSEVAQRELRRQGVDYRYSADRTHDRVEWYAHGVIEKRWANGELYEIVEFDNNLLMTAGATALWQGLSTSGLGTPFTTTNAQLAVGDASTAATAADTDMGAVAGTKLNAADPSSASNATPIVISGTFSPTPVAGQVVVCSGFSGAGAAAINNTFEMTATTNGSTITLLNSAGTGAITVTGGLVKPINKYRQQANGTGSAVVTTNSIVYVAVFGTANANHAWNEWGLTTGAAATNKQAAPPPTLFNHAVPGGGLGTKTSASAWTLTTTLSLA